MTLKEQRVQRYGRNIKFARIRKGWDQEALAKRVGVSKQTISNIEVGRVRPRFEHLDKIMKELEMNRDNIENLII